MNDETTLQLDAKVYRIGAIKKAAYKFADRAFVAITTDQSHFQVTFKAKQASRDVGSIADEFRNEVLDQELRETVAAETEGVRNLILAQAFSATSLLDPVGETGDFHSDPSLAGPEDRTRG